MELEELLSQLRTRCKSKVVIGKIDSLIKDGKRVRSVEDLGDFLND